MASCNVSTLAPAAQASKTAQVAGQILVGKIQIMEMLFHGEQLGIVAVQEGRAKTNATLLGTYYEMFISAAVAGLYGVQVWIAKALGFNVQSVLRKSPRLMAVVGTILKAALLVAVISAHAPTEPETGKDSSLNQQFFDELGQLVRLLVEKYPQAFLLLLGDLNARLGSVNSQSVGSENAVQQNTNGSLFHTQLLANGLVAINTFLGAGATWRHALGKTARIDYVCCLVNKVELVTRVWVSDRIDTTLNESTDHSAVCVCFSGVKVSEGDALGADSSGKDKAPLPALKVDSQKLRDPVAAQRFSDMLWGFIDYSPRVQGCIDNHQQRWSQFVRQCALQCFGGRTDAPRKPWISPAAWSGIRLLAPLRRQAHACVELRNTVLVRAIFFAWAALLLYPFTVQDSLTVAHVARGWLALAKYEEYRSTFIFVARFVASMFRATALIVLAVKACVNADR